MKNILRKKGLNPSPLLKFIPQNTLHKNSTAEKIYHGGRTTSSLETELFPTQLLTSEDECKWF